MTYSDIVLDTRTPLLQLPLQQLGGVPLHLRYSRTRERDHANSDVSSPIHTTTRLGTGRANRGPVQYAHRNNAPEVRRPRARVSARHVPDTSGGVLADLRRGQADPLRGQKELSWESITQSTNITQPKTTP